VTLETRRKKEKKVDKTVIWRIVVVLIVILFLFSIIAVIIPGRIEIRRLQTELDKNQDEIVKLNGKLAEGTEQIVAIQGSLLDNLREIRRLRAIISCLSMEDTIDLEEMADGTFILKSSTYPHVEFPPDYDPLGLL
jgi:ABC-type multidrug transport system fused ATPase/permease subunit